VETASYKSRIRVNIRIVIRLFFILTISLSSTLLLNQNKVYAATISPVELSNSPTADWRSISMTEDGTKIVAGATSGIWVSSDSGASWTQRNSTSNINSVKLSSDGTKIYATYRGRASSQVLISNDFGLSWSTSRPTGYECWDACALDISSDGTKIYLINYGAGVYVSSNSGTSWTQTNSNRYNFTSVASSSSGQYVLVSEELNNKLYLSSDYGQTWINLSAANSFNTNWVSVDISDDGQKLVATGYGNYVYTSSNGGTTWTTRTAVSGTQVRVASSSDGNVIVATNWGSNLRLTTDGGANWDSEPVNRYWFTPAINPSGTKAYMGIGESNGKIYSLTISSSPSAPTSLSATAGNGQATISFTAGSNGGSAITNYKYSLDGTTYTALSPTDATSPVTITGLTNGTSYSISLKAVNSSGDSAASAAVSVTPSTTPSAPTSLTATAGNSQATISFTAGSNGGSAITNYKYSLDGTNYTALSPTDATSPVTITGLTNGTSYSIYLKAVNANGDSSASAAVSVTPSTTPSAPTSLTATAGDGQATISFTAGSDGGSTITNYKYSTDGTTYTTLSPVDSSSPITIPGLTNGTAYTIYLKAVNSSGDSSASSSVSVTPVAPVVPTSDSSGPNNYFEPIRKIEVSNGKIKWEPNKKVVISSYDSNSKKNTIIESVNGQLVLPKAKPGQSVSYSVMATDGTVLKEVTMKTKPNAPKIAKVASQKSEVLTKNKKMAISAQWAKDSSHKKYLVKITLDNGKAITATTTDPNFSIITDETKGATLTITAIGKNNLTSTVSRKI
jgi:hypothetical protein